MHNQGSHGTFPENLSLICSAVQKEMCGQAWITKLRRMDGRTDEIKVTTSNESMSIGLFNNSSEMPELKELFQLQYQSNGMYVCLFNNQTETAKPQKKLYQFLYQKNRKSVCLLVCSIISPILLNQMSTYFKRQKKIILT